jgi:hypothetical protein
MCLGCFGLENSHDIKEAFLRARVVDKPCAAYSQLIITQGGVKRALSEPVDAFGVPLRRRRIETDLPSSATASVSSASDGAKKKKTLEDATLVVKEAEAWSKIPLESAPRRWWKRFPRLRKCFASYPGIFFPDNPHTGVGKSTAV